MPVRCLSPATFNFAEMHQFETLPGDQAAKFVRGSCRVGSELKVPRNIHAVMQYAHDQDLVTGLLVEDDVRTVLVAAEPAAQLLGASSESGIVSKLCKAGA